MIQIICYLNLRTEKKFINLRNGFSFLRLKGEIKLLEV